MRILLSTTEEYAILAAQHYLYQRGPSSELSICAAVGSPRPFAEVGTASLSSAAARELIPSQPRAAYLKLKHGMGQAEPRGNASAHIHPGA
eukprot:6193838-Pleurochrysis_carterae.AAC.3